MKILFMTIGGMEDIESHSIYCDLLRYFRDEGHDIYTISPYEKRAGKNTEYCEANGVHMLHMTTGNLTRSNNLIEKGLATISVEPIFINGIKTYFSDVKFDLVMYSTPPITFCNAIEYVKKRDNAKTYLLLKDIFPQNAVDIGIMSKNGVKGVLYKVFRKKEKKLYRISDHIGCMSQANVDYVIKHNSDIDSEKVEVCPNSVEVRNMSVDSVTRENIRQKYDIPQDKKVFIYGGNLGKPQGIDFLIKCIHSQRNNKDAFFLVVGDGTEYKSLEYFSEQYPQDNFKLMRRLPKEDYDAMVGACDVGMIFLDHRFTIPNFPSRLLSYMQAKIPVLVCTDPNTDIGNVCVDNGFGWWCESNKVKAFNKVVEEAVQSDLKAMGEAGFKYLEDNYSSEIVYQIIMRHFE